MKTFHYSHSRAVAPPTLALSDHPKDCTVTSRRFSNIFLRTSYSLMSAWFTASIFSWWGRPWVSLLRQLAAL